MDSKKRRLWPYGWTHRDTVWLLIWLFTVLILSISFILADDSLAMGYISFTSTIVSIILALVAIFYTMVQASDTNQMMSVMKERLDQVSTQTSTLLNLRPIGDTKTAATAIHWTPITDSVTPYGPAAPPETPPEAGIRQILPDASHITLATMNRRDALALMKEMIGAAIRTAPLGKTVTVSKNQLVDSAVLSGAQMEDAIRAVYQLLEERYLTIWIEPEVYRVDVTKFVF